MAVVLFFGCMAIFLLIHNDTVAITFLGLSLVPATSAVALAHSFDTPTQYVSVNMLAFVATCYVSLVPVKTWEKSSTVYQPREPCHVTKAPNVISTSKTSYHPLKE